MRKTILLITLALCLAGVTAGGASAHSCIISAGNVQSLGLGDYTLNSSWTCGLGSGSATVTLRFYVWSGSGAPGLGINGWVAVSSPYCSRTMTITTSGSYRCNLHLPDYSPDRAFRGSAKMTHHTSATDLSPNYVWR